MHAINHHIHINATAEKIYTALSTAAGIRSWWTKNADLDEQVGGLGLFRFEYNGTVETVARIINLQEPALVVWAVERSFRPEQVGTVIRFELCPEGQGTALSFSQSGYAETGETYALMDKGWQYYLASLKIYIESGKGAPSPDLDWDILNENP